jgi:glycosyltransferase involved in cell wall biosynthesis
LAPTVSIILPTYNRQKFLTAAIDSIKHQSYDDWELIVVDDGSRDDTVRVLEELTADISGRVTIIAQENQGPGIARNRGIQSARGTYIAFYDSDDTWDAIHLSSCVEALNQNPDVDWVYASFRRVNFSTNAIIDEDEFHRHGVPAAFLSLKTERRGNLQVLRDKAAMSCLIEHGLGIGLRVSVVRRAIFDRVEFPKFRIGEDQVLYIRAHSAGARFGYLPAVQATAYVHDSNISDVSGRQSTEKSISVSKELVVSLRSLTDLPLTRAERRTLNRRVGQICVWNIGYRYATAENYSAALKFIGKGVALCPRNVWFWKTYVSTSVKFMIHRIAKGRAAEKV